MVIQTYRPVEGAERDSSADKVSCHVWLPVATFYAIRAQAKRENKAFSAKCRELLVGAFAKEQK